MSEMNAIERFKLASEGKTTDRVPVEPGIGHYAAMLAKKPLTEVLINPELMAEVVLGAQARHAPLDLLGRRVREEQIQDLDLVALRAQSRRQVGKGHEEARTLLERVRRIDQQDAHEALRNAGLRRYGDAASHWRCAALASSPVGAMNNRAAL